MADPSLPLAAQSFQRSATEYQGCHEQKKKNAVDVCACVVLLYHRGYRGGDISKIQRRRSARRTLAREPYSWKRSVCTRPSTKQMEFLRGSTSSASKGKGG